jgi:ribonuclease-3
LLYQGFDRKEGELTLLRTKLVEQGQLVLLAEDLNLAQYLWIGKGVKLEGRARNYLLANAFEALTAAIYLEQGFEKSKLFINKIITPYLQKWIKSSTIKNAKNDLQELTQETLRCLPEYRLVEESGPAHNRNFIVSVSLKNKEVGRGEGKSKKEAEIIAAQKALSKLTSRKQ